MFRRINDKSLSAIVAEWDALANLRYEQITSGRDVTYADILVPAILKLLAERPSNDILDVGCGVGVLSSRLTEVAPRVVAIDPSKVSISIARQNFKQPVFAQATVEDYAKDCEGQFDFVVANMVLMDVLNLESFLRSTRKLLRTRGAFVFSITHPWFWPEYYGYSAEPWFVYTQEIIIEGPFKTTYDSFGSFVSTHVHRPLQAYVEEFHKAGLLIETLAEPMPSDKVSSKYPVPWRFPRYLTGVARVD